MFSFFIPDFERFGEMFTRGENVTFDSTSKET